MSAVFTAGTVALGTPVVAGCTVTHIVPGNSGDCTVAVTTGATDEPANVTIDVAVVNATVPGSVPQSSSNTCVNSPATGLYDGTSNGLHVTLASTDGVTPVASYSLSGLAGASSSTTNLLPARSVAGGTTETYTLHWSMPNNGCTDNNYQGASSTFTSTVYSAQSANQPVDVIVPGNTDNVLHGSR